MSVSNIKDSLVGSLSAKEITTNSLSVDTIGTGTSITLYPTGQGVSSGNGFNVKLYRVGSLAVIQMSNWIIHGAGTGYWTVDLPEGLLDSLGMKYSGTNSFVCKCLVDASPYASEVRINFLEEKIYIESLGGNPDFVFTSEFQQMTCSLVYYCGV